MQEILAPSFRKVNQDQVELLGGKASGLVRLFHAGMNVPPGFIITTVAFREYLSENKIDSMISGWLNEPWQYELGHLERFAEQIRETIVNGEMPDLLDQAIRGSYEELISNSSSPHMIAARSSGLLEDSSSSSFAGQYSSSLGLKSVEELYFGIKECWASAFSQRLIRYKLAQHISLADHAIGVVVQELIPAEKAGVIFTAHPISGREDVVVIEASWGLGDPIVSGRITPDHFELSAREHTYLSRRLGTKKMQLALNDEHLEFVEVPHYLRDVFCLSDDAIWELVLIGKKIEHIFGCSVDVEWVMRKEDLYIVQARPITVRRLDSYSSIGNAL